MNHIGRSIRIEDVNDLDVMARAGLAGDIRFPVADHFRKRPAGSLDHIFRLCRRDAMAANVLDVMGVPPKLHCNIIHTKYPNATWTRLKAPTQEVSPSPIRVISEIRGFFFACDFLSKGLVRE